MKGLWKNNLGGYNRKGSKRKKQTLSNHIRENARAVYRIYTTEKEEEPHKKFDESIMREETQVMWTDYFNDRSYLYSFGHEYIYNTMFKREMDNRISSTFSKTKKEFLRTVSKSTRASVRQWIFNANWDAERDIPIYEKDISYWLFY